MQRCVLISTVLAVFGLVPANLSAIDQKVAKERITYIQKMSTIERSRLERNIQNFSDLSQDEKDHYRQLHSQVTTDRVQGTGSLFSLMQTYDLWLQTLSPLQQDELQRERDVARKLVLVRRYKEQQEKEQKKEQEQQLKLEQETPAESRDKPQTDSEPMIKGNFFRITAMDKYNLDSVMRVIANDLPAGRKKPEYEIPRLNQYCNIINDHAQWKESYTNWPDAELMQKIKKALSPRMTLAVEHLFMRKESTERETFIRLMLMGIAKQANDSFTKPTEDERKQTFDALSKEDQEKLKKVSQERQRQILTAKFFELKGDDSFKKAKEYRDNVIELFEKMEVPLPPSLEKHAPNRPPDKKPDRKPDKKPDKKS